MADFVQHILYFHLTFVLKVPVTENAANDNFVAGENISKYLRGPRERVFNKEERLLCNI